MAKGAKHIFRFNAIRADLTELTYETYSMSI